MIDIHTHILYNIDDGVKFIEDSIDLIQSEIENDIDAVVLTPHFDPLYDSFEKFIEKRDERYNVLSKAIKDMGLNVTLYMGSEVFYSQVLLYYNTLNPLCFNNKYLLIEFSPVQKFDKKFFNDFGKIIKKFDVVPIIAHVEMYTQIIRHYKKIYNFRDLGCIIQVNADSILDTEYEKFIKKIFEFDLADIVASDCHDKIKRPPRLKQAMETIKNIYGEAYYEKILVNQKNIQNN